MVVGVIRGILRGLRSAPGRFSNAFKQARGGFTEGAEGASVATQAGRTVGQAGNTMAATANRVASTATGGRLGARPLGAGLGAVAVGTVIVYLAYGYFM